MKILRWVSLAVFVCVSIGLFVAGLAGAIPEELVGLAGFGGLFAALASGISYSILSVGRRRTSYGILVGLAGGVIVGAGLRVMMRAVAISSDLSSGFSFGGTSIILMVSLVPSLLLSLGYLYFRRFLPGSSLVKGSLYGAAIGILLGLPIMWVAASELSLARDLIVPVGTFLGLPVIYGLILEVLYSLLKT